MIRFLDIIASICGLIILSPLFIILGIWIKLDSKGPIFYKQIRVGQYGKDFALYKFRSMRVGADKKGLITVGGKDNRITKVGYFIRKYKLDEFPQLLNVLKGDMSLVGPRPHMLKHTDEYSALIDNYLVRHWVKPGITGWAQVTGFRGETEELYQMEGRVKADIWYMEHWSFLLDLFIIYKTFANVIIGEEKAY